MSILDRTNSAPLVVGAFATATPARFVGLDVGAETIKLLELRPVGSSYEVTRRELVEHGKKPGPALLEALERWDWAGITGVAVTGRFAGQLNLPRIPSKQAQLRGCRFLFGAEPATLVNIGSNGFSVLELRASGTSVFRENSRCSQGTGNFLRQLVERFSMTVEEASRLCAEVEHPARLSGRCPVILKTDMTHLANKGEDRAAILAGLFDAVCDNVLVLLKPGSSPARVRLAGGVSRSPRVRRVFQQALGRLGMELGAWDEQSALYLEALGCALVAAEALTPVPALEAVMLPPRRLKLEQLAPLAQSMARVHRMPARAWATINGELRQLVLGFDIGSTGAKIVALDAQSQEQVFDAYRQTLGDPVGAAQDLLRRFQASAAGRCPVLAFGATGSGREIAGSLLTSCYGKDGVYIVNEIVAHATGALQYDARVDTIFEIGGQDAKYIRLAEGRLTDCAMNEACSAGTGSFIEEQGRKFSGIQDVRQLGVTALGARAGISLGQHCSVFMAEVIDEGVAAGVDEPSLISGLYDSIVKNYLNRVKGNRSVGKVIFCQGMPFAADALAAAVARQTGSEVIVPPNPGTVGALGIALLATRELIGPNASAHHPLDLSLFLTAKVEHKDTFLCGATSGCGGVGNRCRIDRLRTVVSGQRSNFTWGGACALHDKATRKQKLPDGAPDPFREREALLQKLVAPFLAAGSGRRVALSDEFMLKGFFPFFTAFLHQAGCTLEVVADAGPETLRRGVQSASIPFCAPMQLFHGLAQRMGDTGADLLFVPMVRDLPRATDQRRSIICPIVQAAPDLVRRAVTQKMLAPRIDFGVGGLESAEFLASCRRLGRELGLGESEWHGAWENGLRVQKEFDTGCLDIGRRALEFCQNEEVVPVVVLGRSYTIHNKTLNSNVPAILREQGAIGIPVDCYPVEAATPHFGDMYWGYGQNVLRAAYQVRRAEGVYALYCSNYSCGPDSFNLHFAAYSMEGKPFAVIETDGHAGDAGTKTRVEAFLHCVEAARQGPLERPSLTDFANVQFSGLRLRQIGRYNGETERMLVPYIGPVSQAVTAVFRGVGLDAECLPGPDAESLHLGRRHTSGKECLPMPLTLGSLLQRLQGATAGERFVYVMPSTDGPCRFGVYNLLNQIVLERLGWRSRLRIWSPKDTGYFDDLPAGTEMLMLAGILASDLLLQAKLEVRPQELAPGQAEAAYQRWFTKLLNLLETSARGDLRLGPAVWQVASGRVFGVCALLKEAGAEFAALRGARQMPMVELTGEIYVRAVDFSNDFLIDKLEARGMRVHVSPQSEWLAYCGYSRRHQAGRNRVADFFSNHIQHRIEAASLAAIGPQLGWPVPPSIEEALQAAEPYVSAALEGEAVLTVGGPLAAWRRRQIDAVVSVGPLECMPTKIAEAQFGHVTEREGLLNLTLAFNGEPINTAALDNFAYEVHSRFKSSACSCASSLAIPQA